MAVFNYIQFGNYPHTQKETLANNCLEFKINIITKRKLFRIHYQSDPKALYNTLKKGVGYKVD